MATLWGVSVVLPGSQIGKVFTSQPPRTDRGETPFNTPPLPNAQKTPPNFTNNATVCTIVMQSKSFRTFSDSLIIDKHQNTLIFTHNNLVEPRLSEDTFSISTNHFAGCWTEHDWCSFLSEVLFGCKACLSLWLCNNKGRCVIGGRSPKPCVMYSSYVSPHLNI